MLIGLLFIKFSKSDKELLNSLKQLSFIKLQTINLKVYLPNLLIILVLVVLKVSLKL